MNHYYDEDGNPKNLLTLKTGDNMEGYANYLNTLKKPG